jgi:L-aminopeptidase/D-esterase-like protein
MHLVEKVHAILLSGGSAFGLDAASGVMRYLDEKGIGFNAGVAKVPIVPAAILFDLGIGDPKVRPDSKSGYHASQNASSEPFSQGNIGAGMGCTVGKILGSARMMKSGLGTASQDIGGGIVVGAIVAVNPFGDVVDPQTNEILAGARTVNTRILKIGASNYFANTMETMKTLAGRSLLKLANRSNTVIGVIATNAKLDKNEANKVAQMAQDGIARAVRPSHTMFDGDTIFTLATGEKRADVNIVGAFAAEVLAQAIVLGVLNADPILNISAATQETKYDPSNQ